MKLIKLMWLGILAVMVGCAVDVADKGKPALAAADAAGRSLPALAAKPVRVAVFTDRGARSPGAFRHLQIATFAKGVEGYPVDGAAIRAGALDQADVLVMPGGGATSEGNALGEEGRRRVREFVKNGGGYIGTCAGCYFAMQPHEPKRPYIGMLPYVDGQSGGHADMMLKYNPEVSKPLGFTIQSGRVDYSGGPVMMPGKPVEGADFKVLATFNSDVNESKEPRETMAGKPAIVVGTFGKGRVFASAVHPEKDIQDHYLMRAAYFHASGGRQIEWTLPHRRQGQLAVGFVCDNALNLESAKFAQRLMRLDEFDIDPMSAGIIANESACTLDVLLVPDCAECDQEKGGLGKNRKVTEAFLKRGGRIVVWGCLAQAYAKLGAGVTVVKNGDEALAALRAIAKEPPQPWQPLPPKVEKPVRVAFYTDNGGGCYPIAELLEFAPEFQLNIIGAEDIRQGVLKQNDLSVQPGGLSGIQYSHLGPEGRAALIDFVRGGGSFYGICAGAFLALEKTTNKPKHLDFVPFKHDGGNYRGWKTTTVDLTDEGRKVFETAAKSRDLEYWGGPVMVPGEPKPGADTDIKVLATYTANCISTCSPDARTPMTGKAAFVAGRVGKGKVFVSAPHPESFHHSTDMVLGILKYLTGVRPTWNLRARRRGDYVVGYESRKNKDFALFCVKGLMHEPGFYAWDMHDRSVHTDMTHLDALLLINPTASSFGPTNKAFIDSGRPIIAIALTERQVRASSNRKGVWVARSYDEVIPLLKKLKAEGQCKK